MARVKPLEGGGSQIGDHGVAEMLQQPAGMARRSQPWRSRLDVPLMVPLQELRDRHALGLGVADLAVLGDEPGERDLCGAKVAVPRLRRTVCRVRASYQQAHHCWLLRRLPRK